MILKPELAQEIIDYTAHIVSYVVNIMNTDGVIIASTDQSRLGEVHLGAKQVLASGEDFVMDEVFASKNPLYVPGINLPIRFRDEIIGVLGVGAADESRLIGGILLSTIELLVEKSFMQNEINIENQVRTEFLSHLLTESWHDNEKYFVRQMELHGLEMENSYAVICVEIPEKFFTKDTKGLMGTGASEVIKYERMISETEKRLEQMMIPYKPTILFQPNLIVFLLRSEIADIADRMSILQEYVEKVSYSMNHLSVDNWRIGVGGFAENMSEIHKCFRHATYALKIASSLNPDEQITFFKEYYTEYELLALPQKKREHYYKSVLGDLLLSENAPWLETLDLFFQKDKSAIDTAESLFIHRNTLLFRFRKIEKITGLSPLSFKDSITLYEALMLWKLRDFDATNDNMI